MVRGGRPLHVLERVRKDHPLVLHGVSLSIGGTDPLDTRYLQELRALADRIAPAWVSDHLCWTGGRRAQPARSPAPAVDGGAARPPAAARSLRCRTPWAGRSFSRTSRATCRSRTRRPEWEFLAELVGRSGCDLLLDVNNVYVSAFNHGFEPRRFIDAIPAEHVVQIHLAGHADHGTHLLDTHDAPVADPVWELYRYAIERLGPRRRPWSSGMATCRRSRWSRKRRCAPAAWPRTRPRRRAERPSRWLHCRCVSCSTRLRALIIDPHTLDRTRRRARSAVLAALAIRGGRPVPRSIVSASTRSMYFLRLRDTLATDYVALRRALGDTRFDDLVRALPRGAPERPPFAARPGPPPARPYSRHPAAARDLARGARAARVGDGRRLRRARSAGPLARARRAPRAGGLAPLPARSRSRRSSLLACTLRGRRCCASDSSPARPLARRRPRSLSSCASGARTTGVRPSHEPVLEMAALRWLRTGGSFAELCGWLAEVRPRRRRRRCGDRLLATLARRRAARRQPDAPLPSELAPATTERMQLEAHGLPIHTRSLSVTLLATAATSDRRSPPTSSTCASAASSRSRATSRAPASSTTCSSTARSTPAHGRSPHHGTHALGRLRGERAPPAARAAATWSDRVDGLAGTALDDGYARRLGVEIGGPRGCSHVLTLAQLLGPTSAWALDEDRRLNGDAPRRAGRGAHLPPRRHRRRLRAGRRPLLDAADERPPLRPERAAERPRATASQHSSRCASRAAPHHGRDERRLDRDRRAPAQRAPARHRDLARPSGSQRAAGRCLAAQRHQRAACCASSATPATIGPLLDALLMLAPATIQCMASFIDTWTQVPWMRAGGNETGGYPDSCYMWRRDGALGAKRFG